jgi:phosphate/sulfate permease
MVFVLIFALPLSSTHVVISSLTGVSLIYYTSSETHITWFVIEITLWLVTPFIATGLTWACYRMIQKHIFKHPNARKRVVILIPWYITFCLYFMFTISLTKNYHGNLGNTDEKGSNWTTELIIALIVFPMLVMPLSRYYLLMRARSMHKHAELEQKLTYGGKIGGKDQSEV